MDNSTLLNRIETLEAQLESLRDRLREVFGATISDPEKSAIYSDLIRENNTLKTQLAEAWQENERLRNELERIEKISKENINLKQQISEYQEVFEQAYKSLRMNHEI